MPNREERQFHYAARDVRITMTALHDQIDKVGATVGKLMALADNYDGAETLASIRSDTAWQLVRNLSSAYDELAGFLQSAFKAQPEQEIRPHE